jgi:hypothetical protein
MTQQEQRSAIAEACGFKREERGYGSYTRIEDGEEFTYYSHDLPDFLTDLNAMHEAEEALHNKNHAQLCVVYRDYLNEFMERDQSHGNAQGLGYHANAAQRAEAFLRTLNLWKE